MEKIKVSIICCVFNQDAYLRQCLDSLVCQETDFNYEIIVHDDASTDNSQKIIREYELKYPKIIKSVCQIKNQFQQGVQINERFIYPLVRGEYVAFCEGDDCWSDRMKIKKQADILDSNGTISLCVHDVEIIDSIGKKNGNSIKPSTLKYGIIGGHELIEKLASGVEPYPFQTTSYMIRKSALFTKHAFTNVFGVGDIPLMLNAALNGDIFYMNDTMSFYRINVRGSHMDKLKDKNQSIDRLKKTIKGWEVFDYETKNAFHSSLIHLLVYYKAQVAYSTGCRVSSDDKILFKKYLTKKERLIAYFKFKPLGNLLRIVHSSHGRKHGK